MTSRLSTKYAYYFELTERVKNDLGIKIIIQRNKKNCLTLKVRRQWAFKANSFCYFKLFFMIFIINLYQSG